MTDRPDDASPLERLARAGTVTAPMLAAGRAYREDWLASVRLAKRANVVHRSGRGQVGVNWTSAARDRYRKASHALGPWRPMLMFLIGASDDPGPEGGYQPESVRYGLGRLVAFYRLDRP